MDPVVETPARDKILYGRRKGPKLSARRQALLRDMLPGLTLDLASLGNPEQPERPLWLEIGFGKGEHIAMQAERNPEVTIIGCEPFINGVAALLVTIEEQTLNNISIHPDDARQVLDALPEASLDRAFLLHPDPWPKARHERRRFLSHKNLDKLSRALKVGAELRIQTDHSGYARWAMVQLNDRDDFCWCADGPGDWQRRPDDWPETRYETKARQSGRDRVYLRFERVPQS